MTESHDGRRKLRHFARSNNARLSKGLASIRPHPLVGITPTDKVVWSGSTADLRLLGAAAGSADTPHDLACMLGPLDDSVARFSGREGWQPCLTTPPVADLPGYWLTEVIKANREVNTHSHYELRCQAPCDPWLGPSHTTAGTSEHRSRRRRLLMVWRCSTCRTTRGRLVWQVLIKPITTPTTPSLTRSSLTDSCLTGVVHVRRAWTDRVGSWRDVS